MTKTLPVFIPLKLAIYETSGSKTLSGLFDGAASLLYGAVCPTVKICVPISEKNKSLH